MSDELSVLARDVGTWDAEVSIVPGPGAPPLSSRGVAVNKLIAGGRWLVMDFINETGFEGHGVYGYDDRRKLYVSTWVDNMRTSLVVAEGRFDAATGTMSYESQATMPDGSTVRWREDTRTVDEDTRTFRQLFLMPEGEIETMTVTYRRRRPS